MKLIIYLVCVILMTSCSIQNRKYTKGWDIQWNKRFHANSVPSNIPNDIESDDTMQTNHAKQNENFQKLLKVESLDSNTVSPNTQNTNIHEQSIPAIKDSNIKNETKLEKKIEKLNQLFKKLHQKTKLSFNKKIKKRKSGSMKVLAASGVVIIILIILLIIVIIPLIAFINFIWELFSFI